MLNQVCETYNIVMQWKLYRYLWKYEKQISGECRPFKLAKNEYEQKLAGFCKLAENYLPEKIHCMFRSDITEAKALNAEAKCKKKQIVLNAVWAKVLLFHESEDALNSLKLTLGHEYTHIKDRDSKNQKPHGFIGKKHKLKCWLTEVHADFEGKRLLGNDNQLAADAQEYKEKWDSNKKWQKSLDCFKASYPSIDLRVKYLADHDAFNESLIRRVAKDAKCTDVAFIDEMCKFYEGQEIILH